MKLRTSCFGMDYEMETIIQALVIQINMVWNQFHEIIHELIRYAHALHGGDSRSVEDYFDLENVDAVNNILKVLNTMSISVFEPC